METLHLPRQLENVLVLGGYNESAEISAVTDYFWNHQRSAGGVNSQWKAQVVSLSNIDLVSNERVEQSPNYL
jgi:hypothetical protein